jgi:hypothetical protein
MRIQFNYSENEQSDANQRFARRSMINRGRYWREFAAIFVPALIWALIVVRESPVHMLAAALVGTSIFYLVYPTIRKWLYASLIPKNHREKPSDKTVHICEVELREEGVWVRQSNVQHLFEWEIVAEIVERPDTVEIFTHSSAGVIIRKRAFADEAERREFVEKAKGESLKCKG